MHNNHEFKDGLNIDNNFKLNTLLCSNGLYLTKIIYTNMNGYFIQIN